MFIYLAKFNFIQYKAINLSIIFSQNKPHPISHKKKNHLKHHTNSLSLLASF